MEVPRRRSHSNRPRPNNLPQCAGGPKQQISFHLVGKYRVQFVNPTVQTDFVTLRRKASLLVWIQERGNGRYVEACWDIMSVQHLLDDGDPRYIIWYLSILGVIAIICAMLMHSPTRFSVSANTEGEVRP